MAVVRSQHLESMEDCVLLKGDLAEAKKCIGELKAGLSAQQQEVKAEKLLRIESEAAVAFYFKRANELQKEVEELKRKSQRQQEEAEKGATEGWETEKKEVARVRETCQAEQKETEGQCRQLVDEAIKKLSRCR